MIIQWKFDFELEVITGYNKDKAEYSTETKEFDAGDESEVRILHTDGDCVEMIFVKDKSIAKSVPKVFYADMG